MSKKDIAYELPNWYLKHNQSGIKFARIEQSRIVDFCVENGITLLEYKNPTIETMEKIRAVQETKKIEEIKHQM